MLHSKSLKKIFLDETICCANYILNGVPTKAVLQVSHKENCSGRLDIINFKVFGYECWAHIPNEKQNKMEPKYHIFIFVVYSEDSKTYRLFDPSIQDVIIHRDVQFHEISTPPNFAEPHVALNLPHPSINPVSINTSSSDVVVLDPFLLLILVIHLNLLKMLVFLIILLSLFLFGHEKHLNLQVLMLVFHSIFTILYHNFLLWNNC
jgi:hypothetical protein